jgi:DNA-binding Lrp family transcriptional regulator
MDQIDYLILSELLKNSQLSFLKIAKELHISSFTVKSRFDKMKKEGIIKKAVVSLDLAKFGYQGKMFLLITNAPNLEKSLTIQALGKMRNIIVVSEIIGSFDIIAIAPIIDFDSVKSLVSDIKKLPSVQRVDVTCIDETMFPISPTFGKILSSQCRNIAATLEKTPKAKPAMVIEY